MTSKFKEYNRYPELIGGLLAFGMPQIFMLFFSGNVKYLIYILGTTAVGLTLRFYFETGFLSDYGREMHRQVRGFQEFIRTAGKQRLQELTVSDPDYFYNILPYAYILGVQNSWIAHFEEIALTAPVWYPCDPDFNSRQYHKYLDKMLRSAVKIMLGHRERDID